MVQITPEEIADVSFAELVDKASSSRLLDGARQAIKAAMAS
jgi:hypothetical protein